jgi:hypothetical protein
MAKTDNSLLEAALLGYQAELARIKAAIADIRKRLGKRGGSDVPGPFDKAPKKQKHRMSPEGRARIAAAQRKRWAKAKKNA